MACRFGEVQFHSQIITCTLWHIKISPTLRNMSPALSRRSFRRGSVRGRLMPKSGGKWKSERGTSGRLHARSFLVIFMGKRGRICIVTLPSLVARRGSDAASASGSARPNVFLLRHAALHLCLGSNQSGKKFNICPFAFKLNKSVR